MEGKDWRNLFVWHDLGKVQSNEPSCFIVSDQKSFGALLSWREKVGEWKVLSCLWNFHQRFFFRRMKNPIIVALMMSPDSLHVHARLTKKSLKSGVDWMAQCIQARHRWNWDISTVVWSRLWHSLDKHTSTEGEEIINRDLTRVGVKIHEIEGDLSDHKKLDANLQYRRWHGRRFLHALFNLRSER